MRMETRDGSVFVFATDSITSPVKTAFLGMTVPATNVATSSFASTFAPAGVFPAVTFCCMITGNSVTPGGTGVVGGCWPSKTAELINKRTKVNTAITDVRIEVYPLLRSESSQNQKDIRNREGLLDSPAFLPRRLNFIRPEYTFSDCGGWLFVSSEPLKFQHHIDFLLDNGHRMAVTP